MTQDMIRSLKDSLNITEYFLARYVNRLAASGALLPLEKSGYLLGSSVAPEFRSRGIYRALVHARLERLKELGLELATIMAKSETSAPICCRLGFETVSEIPVYKKQF